MAKGRNLLLQVDISGTMTTIGALRSKTITINNETIEITNLDSNDWRELNPDGLGTRSISASGSGIFTGDAAAQFIEDACYNRNILSMQVVFENGDILSGNFAITSFVRGGEHTAEETVSMSLEGSGAFVMTRFTTCTIPTVFTFTDRTPSTPSEASQYDIAFDVSTGTWMIAAVLVMWKSTDRSTWVPTVSLPQIMSADQITYIVESNGAGTWITTCTDGTTNWIFRSTDIGNTWTLVDTVTSVNRIRNITYGNGVWVAPYIGNARISIDDGLTWGNTGTGTAGASVATDGAGNWTLTTNWQAYSSDNGVSWTQGWRNISGIMFGMLYANNLWVAVGSLGQILTSINGVTWTERQAQNEKPVSGKHHRNIAYYGTGWIASGDFGMYQTSVDGITWSNLGTLGPQVAAVEGNDGCLIIADANSSSSKIWEGT